VMLAYFALANLVIFELYRSVFDPDRTFTYTLLSTDWATWLFFGNFLFLIWRLANRMVFTGMIYSTRHALMAAPRLIVGNFVNFFATWRAIRVYVGHRVSGTPLVWDKTSHSYPVHMGDITLPISPGADAELPAAPGPDVTPPIPRPAPAVYASQIAKPAATILQGADAVPPPLPGSQPSRERSRYEHIPSK
jgi:adsorption protein B